MAFNLKIEESGLCEKCKQPASIERPLVDMWITGRSYDQRQFIALHENCLMKAIERAKKAATPTQEKK